MEQLFWTSAFIIFYTFIGYGLIITVLAWSKRNKQPKILRHEDLPEVTLLVAAYNEAAIIEEKVENCLALDYPDDKLNIVFVTDGSDDGTPELLQTNPKVTLFHQPMRNGKIAAVNRAMEFIESPIVVFSDANVMVNKEGLRKLVSHFQNNLVGAVSGEKRVLSKTADGASASGEGLYWKYESYLKRKDAAWNSLVGSAGELFAIRRLLFEPVKEDCLIEDFIMTMQIAASGYRVAYEPNATATETASANIAEESKRKVRIAAGGIQAIQKLIPVVKPLSQPKLFFQYFSHRVLRWTLMPPAMLGALVTAMFLWNDAVIYQLAAVAQLFFYLMSFIGYLLRDREINLKGFFAPYYFVYMHCCVVKGWVRYAKGQQKVTWEKAERATISHKLVESGVS